MRTHDMWILLLMQCDALRCEAHAGGVRAFFLGCSACARRREEKEEEQHRLHQRERANETQRVMRVNNRSTYIRLQLFS